MSEWSLIDVERRRRRLSEIAFRNAVYQAALEREKTPFLQPNRANHSAKTIGSIGRSMLVSWIFAESEEKLLKPSTAFLAVNYMERALSDAPIKLGKVQEMAVVCLQLATKIDATGGDSMDLPYFNHLPTAQLELFALQVLDWQLVVPTPWTFLSMFSEKFWLPIESRRKALIYLKNILYCELLPIVVSQLQTTKILTLLVSESQHFYSSVLALTSILLLERDNLLPATCKDLAMGVIKDGQLCATDVKRSFRIFRNIRSVSDDAQEMSDSSSGSSTTAYPCSGATSRSSMTSGCLL